MSLDRHGKNTLNYEISNITSNGIWLIIKDQEYFISFKDFPQFQDVSINDIFDLKFYEPDHLYWEKLDIDIELDSLENPERFPLAYDIPLK